ncbi:MAG: TFIIB-type zinc ribbon-containing protein [Planctomycetota bacterium]
MIVGCNECGAELRLNPKLAGTSVSCPQCGSKVAVPKASPREKLVLEPDPQAPPVVRKSKRPEPFTFYMMATQGLLLVIALLCFVAAFRPGDWKPPSWSWFGEHPLILMAFGVGFAFCAFMARYWPRVMALLSVLIVCGGILAGVRLHDDPTQHAVDASRALALSATLLAVWLAMEHRRFSRG